MKFGRIVCAVLGHKYRVAQYFGHVSRRVVCLRCGGDWGMNDAVKAFIPWSGDLAEMYERMGYKVRQHRSIEDAQ